MKLAEQIEHLEKFFDYGKPWKNASKSRKWMKKLQHRTWRRWSKQNKDDENGNPKHNRYCGWEW